MEGSGKPLGFGKGLDVLPIAPFEAAGRFEGVTVPIVGMTAPPSAVQGRIPEYGE
jgi:hypothetical protein